MFMWLLFYIGGGLTVIGAFALGFAWLTTRNETLCPGGCGDPEWDCLNKRAMCPPLRSGGTTPTARGRAMRTHSRAWPVTCTGTASSSTSSSGSPSRSTATLIESIRTRKL